ncbi:MAG: amidohydrolase family protein, partial [Oscillospiraceae bacterium]
LRCDDDVKAIIEGVLDGTIDAIATDHAPHSPEEKSDFLKSPNGIVGLETSLAACITVLCKEHGMSMDDLISKMSVNPAKITGIHGGTLRKGSPADIVVFDMDKQWTVTPDSFKSKARNSAFKNMTLTGKVVYTFLNGELVFEDKD